MIDQTIRANLKLIVRAYAKATGHTTTRISKDFYGNIGFFDELFAGERSVSIAKVDEIVQEFRAKWPAKTKWPVCRIIVMRAPEKASGKIIPKKAAPTLSPDSRLS